MAGMKWWCVVALLWCAGAWGVSPGNYLLSYVSAIDGSTQPYGLYIPTPYVAAAAHPVIFIGHGFGGHASATFNATQTGFANANGFLLVKLEGRGGTFYDGVGEVDFFDVLAILRANYNLDLRRLYFEGVSMGATGAYRLGLRHPDLLAAVGGVDGWGDYRSWHHQWYAPLNAPNYVEPFRVPNLLMASGADIAEGGRWQHVYLFVDANDTTVYPENTYFLNARLDALAAATPEEDYWHTLKVNTGAGHGSSYVPANQALLYEYFKTQALPASPPWQVAFHTTRLKYGRMYWLRINRVQRVNETATISAGVTGNTISVTTGNILSYTLFLDSSLLDPNQLVTVITDGLPSYSGPARTVTLYAALHSSGAVTGWSESDAQRPGLRKTAALEGPIGDAYTSKFLVVYGADGSAADTSANKAEADTFCQYWNAWMRGGIAPRTDASITAADMAGSNVILFGTAQSNAIIRMLQPELPIQVTDSGVTVGSKQYLGAKYGAYFIYPNPRAPVHYVVVSHRGIPGACAKDLEALPWYWPDYVVFDSSRSAGICVQNKLAYLPATFVDTGYFDAYWRLNLGESRPDLLIRAAGQAEFDGDNLYNIDDGQSASRLTAAGATASYDVQVQNDGNLDDSMVLTATPGGSGMRVKYLDVPTGADITVQITAAAGWRIPLDKDAARMLRVQVTLDAALAAGTAREVLVTATSVADGTLTDQVRAITRANSPPLAHNDAYTLQQNALFAFPAPGVLANDSDADGNALAAVKVSDPAHGKLTLNADGSFFYQPALKYVGTDSFRYRATDGLANSATATVTFTIVSTGIVAATPPRPRGDGIRSAADRVQAGRYAGEGDAARLLPRVTDAGGARQREHAAPQPLPHPPASRLPRRVPGW